MDRNAIILARDLSRTNAKLEHTEALINIMKNKIIKDKSYTDDLLPIIYNLENITMHIRNIANTRITDSCGKAGYSQALQHIGSDIYHIQIRVLKGNITRITLPCLLPHWKENNKNLLTGPLNEILGSLKKSNQLSYYESVVIAIQNHVVQQNRSNKIRDNDNYECHQIINTLALWFFPDDSPDCAKMYYTTVPDSSNYTVIYLIPPEEFSEWVKIHC